MVQNSKEVDHAILKRLYRDGTLSSQDIADETSIDKKTIEDRMEAMKQSGAIGRSTSVIDPVKAGQEVPSYHFASFDENYDQALNDEMAYFSYWTGSQLGMVVLGDYDMIFRKVSESSSDVDIFASNVLGGSTQQAPDTESLIRSQESYEVNQRIRWHGKNIPSDEQRRGRVENNSLAPVEKNILEKIQENASLRHSPERLADKIDKNPAEVYDSLDNLIDKEVILGNSIEFYPSAMEPSWYRAFYGLSIEKNYENVITQLQSSEPLHVPYVISGSGFNWADIAAELVVPSVELLDNLTDELRSIEGVKASRTYLSTKELYHDDRIPIPE